jgi:hypothetical protein
MSLRKCSVSELERLVDCRSHGRKRWQGHIVCEACGRKFSTHDPALPTHAPEVCGCGARLMPPSRGVAKREFTARVCCADCFATPTPPAVA